MKPDTEKSLTLLDCSAIVLAVTGLCLNAIAIIYPTGVTDDGTAPPSGETEKLLQRQLLTLQNQRLLIVHTANILLLSGLWILCRDRRRYLPKSSALLACALAVFVTGLCCQGTVVFVMAGCTLESTPPPPAPAEMTSCLGMIHLEVSGFLCSVVGYVIGGSTIVRLMRISTPGAADGEENTRLNATAGGGRW